MPYEKPDNTWISITIEMDLDKVMFSRWRYTAFDLLSDVGGLSGMFASIFAVFMAAWNFNALDNYMVARLFKVRIDEQVSKKKKSRNENQSEFLATKCGPYFKDYVLSWVPSCMLCCKLSRREKAFAKARDRLEKEMNIIELVKSRRYFAKALKTLLPKSKRIELREQTRYILVDPSAEEPEKMAQVDEKHVKLSSGHFSLSSLNLNGPETGKYPSG